MRLWRLGCYYPKMSDMAHILTGDLDCSDDYRVIRNFVPLV